MTPEKQKLVRDVVAAKRYLDAAEKEYQKARNTYRLAESLYLKHTEGHRPNDVFCDPFFIEATDCWHRNDGENRLEFTEAERCPTSE